MDQLTAVRTTGIYCRSGCAGRPKIQNVELFTHRAAAESAGYRACLRCRPDQLPVPETDPSVPDVVSKALELINDGFLDTGSEEDLGAAIGIHHRQLRRIFSEHVGATATKVAVSRRAHFARRLLDETNLSMDDVAYASGFRSVRQFRRVVRDTFQFSPSELRKRRRRGSAVDLDGGVRLRIPLPPNYPVEQVFTFLAQRATPGTELVDRLLYRRTAVSCGHVGVVEVEGNVENHELAITAHLPTLVELLDIVGRTRKLFGLRSSNLKAVDALNSDPALQRYIDSPSVFIPGAWDPFESAIRIIVGQQVSVLGASTVTGQLASLCGTKTPELERFGLSRCFPTTNQIAETDLSSLGMPRKRQQTLRTYAEWAAQGLLPAPEKVVDSEEVVAELEQIPGVGPWTSNLIAMRAFGLGDAFPSGDLGIRKGATAALGMQSLIKESELAQYAQRWRPYRSVAAALLWEAAADYTKESSLT